MKKSLLIAAGILGLMIVGFIYTSTSPSSHATITTSAPPAAFATYSKNTNAILIDVRTPGEFAEGHLKNALNIDVSAPDFVNKISALDPNAHYAIYCRSGNRTNTALSLMQQAGFKHVIELEGGIIAWNQAGLPL